MISAWWLLLIVPFVSMAGVCLGGMFATKGHLDDCADCQYNCKTCQYKKEKSN
jgi:hypothetical protein